MRPPGPVFDVRAALAAEVRAAQAVLVPPFDAHAVHAGRVRLKRARALARLGANGAPGLFAVFNDSARAAMRLLAPARENGALAALARSAAKDATPKAGAALAAAAERFSFAANIDNRLEADLAAALKDLYALAQVWPETSARQITRGAEAIIRRTRRARKRARFSDDAELRHTWRRREKEHLFAAEALGADWPGPRRNKRANRLTAALGKERDARILIDRLSTAPVAANDAPPPRKVFKLLRRLAKRWRKRADARARKLAR